VGNKEEKYFPKHLTNTAEVLYVDTTMEIKIAQIQIKIPFTIRGVR
jgi:hypothetical protein